MEQSKERQRWLAGVVCGALRVEGSIINVKPEYVDGLPSNRVIVETTMGQFMVTIEQM